MPQRVLSIETTSFVAQIRSKLTGLKIHHVNFVAFTFRHRPDTQVNPEFHPRVHSFIHIQRCPVLSSGKNSASLSLLHYQFKISPIGGVRAWNANQEQVQRWRGFAATEALPTVSPLFAFILRLIWFSASIGLVCSSSVHIKLFRSSTQEAMDSLL